uniref:Bicarbonate transporter-like transmembrane domain-containing protein n=1 Tax=Grammatophora oceanica TaxID=210454 RepID=A0A7S1V1S3_9STRA|mmetsp:Transcript_34481/g.51156  ORF Transcript_34481/g.51156 Transcript_34481/m.51156 type:complete len:620 (+) Transcript_34481:72-1931(+)|eukprot:CAMPEP_0194065570 /NCGR_PEP_ID=MMETSP0009_2-20130614/85543_1 /TAXON_ID=210454 /ORGANISM="Grammatophora oceanica, Strain CCMP 410" /LENGTH=619 /DNA_ID=CAMNT_0038718431 /DNA_START=72 /DNA_END=1931 /DNA_ORIENTATION=+
MGFFGKKGDKKDVDIEASSSAIEDTLKNAGKVHLAPAQTCGRGVIGDIKRTVGTHWFEEVTNFNGKTIPVALLVFISVIAPTLAFGASYGTITNNQIGAIETMLATSWVGVTYSLIGGMPICIIGSTGPVLALSAAIFTMSDSIGVPYLTFNAWISIWLFIYTLLAGFFDVTRYVKLATRFTDEIFALLIVSIFVLDAVGDPFSDDGILRYLIPSHPSHEDLAEEDPDYNAWASGFLSVILGFGTTWLIFFFRDLKESSFGNQTVRNLIFDFSVSASVVVWTVIQHTVFKETSTETLNVPSRFQPTFSCCDSTCTTYFPDECEDQAEAYGTRSWFVDYGDINGKVWTIFFAAVPALLAFLLCYLDSGITWHLINHPSHKLKHGDAYNYDLILVGFFNCVNGMMGLPWLVATTVPCITHLHALAEKDKNGNIVHVHETRLTHFLSHALLGLCMLFLGMLKYIPRPVLKGVFLFMGLAALPSIQFWQRLLNFLREFTRQPDHPYKEYVSKRKVHLYTILQIIFFAGVFTVQNFKAIAIVFPFMTLLCIPGRLYFLPNFFEGWELALLDGSDEDIEEVAHAKEADLALNFKIDDYFEDDEKFNMDSDDEGSEDGIDMEFDQK